MSRMIKIDRLVRSKRKTIALIVERDGRLVVRAPLRLSNRQIEAFVLEKAGWIEVKQALIHNAPPDRHTSFSAGETFLYLGEAYPLEIVAEASSPLTFNGHFYLRSKDLQRARACFESWYRRQALDVISARVQTLADQHSFSFSQIKITSARSRWGSCTSRRNLCFTWRLVMAPLPVIDYVVVHELAHLRQKNHSKAYWALVRTLMPDYQSLRLWLKNNGSQLDL